MTITPTEFRRNLFKYLDSVIKSNEPLDIDRNGTILKIVPPKKKSKFDKLKVHENVINGDDIIKNSWEKEWKPYL